MEFRLRSEVTSLERLILYSWSQIYILVMIILLILVYDETETATILYRKLYLSIENIEANYVIYDLTHNRMSDMAPTYSRWRTSVLYIVTKN